LKLLLDTHLLIWAATAPAKLSSDARKLLEDADNELFFSPASLWEITIKRGLGRPDFKLDPRVLRRGLLDNGYQELPISGLHTLAIDTLPELHKDPFDRLLIAQASAEGITFVTADSFLSQYPGPIKLV